RLVALAGRCARTRASPPAAVVGRRAGPARVSVRTGTTATREELARHEADATCWPPAAPAACRRPGVA
ncbi:hypothetical protein, partial [Nonomuraea rubra]|uniref:hypothetical protein n=1 Tax=Nonomuraea rubra TaxID=46180 RepID=UPI0031EA93BE